MDRTKDFAELLVNALPTHEKSQQNHAPDRRDEFTQEAYRIVYS
jgi:hypothetical protein